MDLVWCYVVGRGDANVGVKTGLLDTHNLANKVSRSSQILLKGSVKKLKLDDCLMFVIMVRS